jgi:adenosylcobinamide-GDP ribazoletransferase
MTAERTAERTEEKTADKTTAPENGHPAATAPGAPFAAARAQGRLFCLSLGFLTRLCPAMQAADREMGLACLYFPAVGAALGAACAAPLAICALFGLFAGHTLAQGWIYVLFSAWLTRCLHLDGLADLLDALGSGKQGEAFQAVLKDSRVGVFGCAGLVLALGGQAALAAACLDRGDLAPLVCAPIFGRCLPILLSLVTRPHPRAGLGALPALAPRAPAFFSAAGGLAAVAVCLPLRAALPAFALAGLCLVLLRRAAAARGGVNGDFFGCAVVAGESAVFLAAAL